MPRPTLYLAILISFFGTVAKASDEVTLIFKRPYVQLDYYDVNLSINDVNVCTIAPATQDKISSCEYKIGAGEIKIKTQNSRGDDFSYVIDIEKGKTYTMVLYKINDQSWNLLWTTLSESLVKNKIAESTKYKNTTYKIQVISIK